MADILPIRIPSDEHTLLMLPAYVNVRDALLTDAIALSDLMRERLGATLFRTQSMTHEEAVHAFEESLAERIDTAQEDSRWKFPGAYLVLSRNEQGVLRLSTETKLKDGGGANVYSADQMRAFCDAAPRQLMQRERPKT